MLFSFALNNKCTQCAQKLINNKHNFKMKKTISISMILTMALFFVSISSCKKDDTETIVNYTLRIENNMDQAYDIYMKNNVSNLDFIQSGYVAANSTLEIQDLTIGFQYTLRGVTPGNSVDDYEFEQVFTSNSNGDDYVLTIDPEK